MLGNRLVYAAVHLLFLIAAVTPAACADDTAPPASKQATALTSARLVMTLPDGWRQAVDDEAKKAKTELEAGMRDMMAKYAADTGNAHKFGIKEFSAVRVPENHGWLLVYSIQIPDQEDYYATTARDNEQKIAWGKQQGIVVKVRSNGLVSLADGTKVYKSDMDMKAGYRQLQVTYWTKDDPGLVSIAQLLFGPKATEAQVEAGVGILNSLRQEYKTVAIGDQEWMAQNLNVAIFRNGDAIPEAKTIEEWKQAYKNESAAWCYYNNDAKNGEKYGKLYNWYAVNDPRGLAPVGWHVPTDAEWRTMIEALGGMGAAFEKMKDPAGFAAVPAGARDYKSCAFHALNNITFWWSSSKNDKWNAWYHAMHFGYKQVGRDNGGMNAGHSVRCVKDKKE